MRKMSLWFK